METEKKIKLLMTACSTALRSDQVGAVMQRVLAAAENEYIDVAIELAKKALGINSINLDPAIVLAVLLLEKKQRIGAMAYFHQVITQDPNNALALWYIACEKLRSGRTMEALALLKAGSECGPTDSYVVLTLAWLFQMLGNANDSKSLIQDKLLSEPSKLICTTLAMLFVSNVSYLSNVERNYLGKNVSCLNNLIHVASNHRCSEKLLKTMVNGSNNSLTHKKIRLSNCVHLINPALELYKNRYGQRIVSNYIQAFFREILKPEITKVLRSNKAKKQTHFQKPSDMVRVPSGEYIIGAPLPNVAHSEKKCFVREFLIDLYPVTNRQWRQFQSNHTFPKGLENHPVTNVDFIQATMYARWKGKRLPTETEWEAAARGPNAFRFPWGQAPDPGRANCAETKPRTITPVTRYPRGASTCGAIDMLGNVLEWVDDWGPHARGRAGTRIAKGGGFSITASNLACWLQNFFPPLTKVSNIGFRCAMDL